MEEEDSTLDLFIRVISKIGALIVGLLLITVGAITLIYAAASAADLYQDPDLLFTFANSLQRVISNGTGSAVPDLEFLWYIAWPIVIFLLLLLGKIGIWSVESGAHLLEIARGRK